MGKPTKAERVAAGAELAADLAALVAKYDGRLWEIGEAELIADVGALAAPLVISAVAIAEQRRRMAKR